MRSADSHPGRGNKYQLKFIEGQEREKSKGVHQGRGHE